MQIQQARKILGKVVAFRKQQWWYYPELPKKEEWIGLVIYDEIAQDFQLKISSGGVFHKVIVDGRTIKVLLMEEAIIWRLENNI